MCSGCLRVIRSVVEADHGKIRSMGSVVSVVTVIGPRMLPISGVIACQSYETATLATQPSS